MTDRIFVDTNIVIYSQSGLEDKATLASEIDSKMPVVSTQVINETVSVLTKKCKFKLAEAHEIAESLLELCEVVPVEANTIRTAITLTTKYSLSHWDSLIVSAALLANCNVLFSEDMQHGQVFEHQLTVINPFQ
jgi:predicted nucleic acid-binding protein